MTRWALYRFSPWLLFWTTLLFGSIWMCTENGLRWLVMMARPHLPAALHIGDVRGSILTGVTVSDVLWDDGNALAHVRDAELALRYRSLLLGEIHVAKLGAGQIRIKPGVSTPDTEPESDPQGSAISLPKLPKFVLGQLAIGPVSIESSEAKPLQIERVRLRAQHEKRRLRLTLQELRQKGLPTVVARLDTTLHAQSLELHSLAVGLESGGEARLSGEVGFADGLRTDIDAEIRALDLQAFVADLTAPIEGDFNVFVTAKPKELPAIHISGLQLGGAWQGHSLQLRARELKSDTQSVDIKELQLRHANAQVRVNGLVGERMNLDFTGDIPDFAHISSELSGSAEFSGTAVGALQQPDIRLRGRLDSLQSAGVSVTKATWDGRVNLTPGQQSNWSMQITDLVAGSTQLDSVNLWIDGLPRALRLKGEATGPDLTLATELRADVRDPQRTPITLNDFRLSWADIEDWALNEPVQILRKQQSWNIAQSCLTRAASNTTLCLGGRYAPDQFRFNTQLNNYPFGALVELAEQEDSQVSGSGSVRAQVSSNSGKIEAQADIETTAVLITGTRDGDPLELLELKPGEGQLRYGSNGLDVELRLPGVEQDGVELALRTNAKYDIKEAYARLGLQKLDLLTILSDEIVRVDGEIGVVGSLKGNLLQQPELALDAALNAKSLTLNSPEIELRSVKLVAKGNSQELALTGGANSGEGVLTLEGRYGITDQSGTIKIDGKDFRILDSALGRVEISPDMELALRAGGANIRGTVRVPFADIHPEALPEAGSDYVTPSPDQVILQDEEKEQTTPFAVNGKLRVVLGRDVNFDGFGLTTGIGGSLELQLEPDKAPVGTGELNLRDGRYKAYGQDLTLERGRIIFSGGPLSTPGIDLRAFRRPTPDVTVGIQIRGSVPKPNVSLWSDPEMTQTEQLSWLVLGRSSRAEGDSEEDSVALQNATLALGLKGGDFLAKRFKGKLGLDELTIGTQPGEQTNQAALVLGKYLNPRIYVSYGIGLFEPIYTFRLRYFISSKWTLQTISGVESGGDIVYTIER